MVFFEHFHEFHEDLRRGPCVIHCPVMVFQRDIQSLCHDIQFILGQSGKEHPRQRHSVHIDKPVIQPQIPAVLPDKSHVEPGIVGHQHTVPHEREELREHGLNIRGIHDHLIRDAGQVCDLKGDRALRVHKGAEPVHDLPVHHFDRPDLDDLIADRAEARGLDIEHDISIVQGLFPRIDRDLCQVVHHVSFHTVNDLKRIVFIQCLYVMIRLRECLRHPVVCDGDGRMPPVMGALYDIFHIRHAVHITHLRMAVELYPFQRAEILP